MFTVLVYALLFVAVIALVVLIVAGWLEIMERLENRRAKRVMLEGLKMITDEKKRSELLEQFKELKDIQVIKRGDE